MFGIHVVLIGTEPGTTRAVRASLAEEGAVITVLAAVSDALAFFRHCIPHLVVVDIAGPGGTAEAVLKTIRSLASPAGEPAAYRIDSSESLEPISRLASGLRSCLARPVDVLVLSPTVRRVRLP